MIEDESCVEGIEIRDAFEDEDCGVDQFIPFRDDQALDSIIFKDSHKRYEEVNDVKTSIYSDVLAIQALIPKKDGRAPVTSLKDGSSNILDFQKPLLSEKAAQESGLVKCCTCSTLLDYQETNISPTDKEVDDGGTRNTPLCSYPFLCLNGVANNKKLGLISSANTFDGALANVQRDSEDNLQFYDCPNIEDGNIGRMFRNIDSTFAQGNTVVGDEISWLSSSSHDFHDTGDTLQTVVFSSASELNDFNNTSSSHGWRANILPVIESVASITGIPSSAGCCASQIYSGNESKGKSILSKLAYDQSGFSDKCSIIGPIGYGIDCRDPNMINTEELYTATGNKINQTLGYNAQCSLSCCDFIQSSADQGLLSSIVSAPQPCSLQASSKKTMFSESYASSCLHSSNNQSKYAPQSIGVLPLPLSMPLTPRETNYKRYASHKFPAASKVGNPLEQHAAGSDSKYKTEDEGVKKKVHESLNLSASNIDPSNLEENSCMTSTFRDNLFQNAVNFQQLQMIIDQLGVRAKLCIRDSLYRLARSAEQSHYYGAIDSVNSGSNPMIGTHDPKVSKRPTAFIGMPINTNAIERSIAYLLFHKSLESFSGTSDDMWLRPPIHIHRPADIRLEPYPPSA